MTTREELRLEALSAVTGFLDMPPKKKDAPAVVKKLREQVSHAICAPPDSVRKSSTELYAIALLEKWINGYNQGMHVYPLNETRAFLATVRVVRVPTIFSVPPDAEWREMRQTPVAERSFHCVKCGSVKRPDVRFHGVCGGARERLAVQCAECQHVTWTSCLDAQ